MTAVVLLCNRGLPPAAQLPDGARLLDDLCRRPGQVTESAAGADRLVLGVCPGESSLGRMQTAAREAGIDPLGIQFVDLVAATAEHGRLEITLAGAAARADAFAGSEPHQAKLSIPDAVSRRQLLRSLVPEYRAAPAITDALCRAPDGCQACVAACPRGALRREGGHIVYDRTRCEPCGRCVTACPVGAIVNPAVTPGAIAAEVAALLAGEDTRPRAIAYACERGTPDLAPWWYAVRVPCSSMVTVPWLLAPLLMGAGATALIPCSASGCPLGYDDVGRATVEFARAFLAAVDASGERVRTAAAGAVPEPWPEATLPDPFELRSGRAVLAAVAAVFDRADADVQDRAAPAGVVTIDPDTCTLCGRCAQGCPTGALDATEAAGTVVLSFDAAACPGCEQCLPRCPELARGAIHLRRTVDAAALNAGRKVLVQGTTRACEVCGRPVASDRLLEHLGEILGPEHAATHAAISRRCASCRQVPAL